MASVQTMCNACCMSHTFTPDDLAMDLADRLCKSLRLSGCNVHDMAAYLEVHRNTVGSWLSGRARPNPATLKLWAGKTGVPYVWLRDGKLTEDTPRTSVN